MKNVITSIFICMFLFSFVSPITFEKETITNVIVPQYDQPAEITLTITNASEGKYNIYTLTDVNIFPTDYMDFVKGSNEIDVKVFPTSNLNARGFYTFVYYLRDYMGVNHDDRMTVKVIDLRDLIEISSDANYPGDQMKFFVKNKDNARLKNLVVKFSSVFFETEEKFDLEPFETKTITVKVDREKIKKISAGAYLLEADFNVDRGESVIKGKISFGESKEIDTESNSEGFFIRTQSMAKINKGNTIETVKLEIYRNLLTSTFTFFSEKPEEVSREGLVNKYSWTKQVGPSETVEVQARTNYTIPLIILVIIFGTIVAFSKYNSTKLEVVKSVSHVKTKGGEFALRVTVHIKAKKSLSNVVLTEKIPAIVQLHENFGAIKPSSINLHDKKVQWTLGEIQSGEDRVISYVVYSKVGVVGRFSLPASIVVFEENGKLSETFSNNVFFLSEQVKKVD